MSTASLILSQCLLEAWEIIEVTYLFRIICSLTNHIDALEGFILFWSINHTINESIAETSNVMRKNRSIGEDRLL